MLRFPNILKITFQKPLFFSKFDRKLRDVKGEELKVLVIDDCIDSRIKVKTALTPHIVIEADNIALARKMLKSNDIDIIVLDVGLPDGSGIDFCEELNSAMIIDKTPLLIISAHTELGSRLAGLHAGADDYLTKPFHSSELRARVEAVMRRFNSKNDDIQIGPFFIEPAMLKVTCLSQSAKFEIVMTPTEFKLFNTLIRHPGQIFSRLELAQQVCSMGINIELRGIDSHICHLRNKLKDHSQSIESVYGKGYKFVPIVE
jgi:DNA-binding response OmpR family regulator